MNVNFFAKDRKKTITAINCIIRFRGERYKLATGVSVPSDIWAGNRADERKGGTDATEANILLDRFENKVKALFEPYRLKKGTPDPAELRAEIKKLKPAPEKKKPDPVYFLPFFDTYYNAANYKDITKKKYLTTYNWLLKYEQRIGRQLTFEDIDLDFYNDFQRWFYLHKRKKKDEAPRPYTSNYFGSLIKCIKRVMDEAGPHGLKLHNNIEYKQKKFKVEEEEADSIYLSVDELMRLHRCTFTPENVYPLCIDARLQNTRQKARALNMVKNKFLIGCFTALRVSDFNRLREVNFKQNVIRIKPKKGTRKNEDVVIPIHPVIREIINSGFDISTTVSDQKLNEHIKEACQLVGIGEPVTIVRTEAGQQVERTYKKYEMVSTHTARRSGATNMYLAGIPSISIMKITGHTTEKSFMKYIKITQEENANLLKEHPFFNA